MTEEKKEGMPAAGTPAGMSRQFYNLRDSWLLKGGCAWNTFKNRRFLQPKGGHYDAYYGGRGVFKAETIREWLPLEDEELPAYHAKYLTGAQPAARIRKARPKEAVTE
jgi:hypothetical protein